MIEAVSDEYPSISAETPRSLGWPIRDRAGPSPVRTRFFPAAVFRLDGELVGGRLKGADNGSERCGRKPP